MLAFGWRQLAFYQSMLLIAACWCGWFTIASKVKTIDGLGEQRLKRASYFLRCNEALTTPMDDK